MRAPWREVMVPELIAQWQGAEGTRGDTHSGMVELAGGTARHCRVGSHPVGISAFQLRKNSPVRALLLYPGDA